MFLQKFFLAANNYYWRRYFFTAKTLSTFLSPLGLGWTISKISLLLNEQLLAPLRSLWPIYLALSFAYTLYVRRPVVCVCETLASLDVKIEITVDDIFNLKSSCVISTNTTFDTKLAGNLISEKSLQGLFTKKFYTSEAHLDVDISSALAGVQHEKERPSLVGGNVNVYKIGTVANICQGGRDVYLVALATLNEKGTASTTFEDVKDAVACLWSFISSDGRYEPIAIPVLGTGHGRILESRSMVIKEIIKSFIAACGQGRKFTSKLSIVINPKDYYEYGIDINELGEYLKFACKFTEINPKKQCSGTPVKTNHKDVAGIVRPV